MTLTQSGAEKLARKLKAMFANGMRSEEHGMDALCDYILSGEMRREIENAAYERAAQVARSWIADAHDIELVSNRIRALIQPPAQKENGE